MTSPEGAETTSILTRVPFPSARFEVARAKQTSEETFSERVARLRREKGLTQEDLAERLDVTQPVVSDYERGRLRLHGELIVQLAAILGVSADEILGLKASGRANRAIKNRRLLRTGPAAREAPQARSAGPAPHHRRLPLQGGVMAAAACAACEGSRTPPLKKARK